MGNLIKIPQIQLRLLQFEGLRVASQKHTLPHTPAASVGNFSDAKETVFSGEK